MIKIYTDINLLSQRHRSYVFPLLFDLYFIKSDNLLNLFRFAKTPEEADILVLALEYNYAMKNTNSAYRELRKKAIELNKPLWVYTGGDFGYSLNDSLVYSFRLGGFKSKLNNRTFVLPSFVNDPYQFQLQEEFKPLPKQGKPSIGFVGHAKSGVLKWLREIKSYFGVNLRRGLKRFYADYQPFFPSSIIRYTYLSTLVKSNLLKTDFILRSSYRAGVRTDETKEKTTQDFFSNIKRNPYTFCIRGAGNFSVRFYETLAVGRIPVLIDTDCQLPLVNHIDWKAHCLIIKASHNKDIAKDIIDFHNSFNDQEFEDLQTSNRELWQSKLTRHGYFKEIHNLFVHKIAKNDF